MSRTNTRSHSLDVKTNMADVGPLKGKPIETVKLSYSRCSPGAISWSLDDRLSVITDQGVYVLTLVSSIRPGLNLEKTFIPNHSVPWTMDVDMNRKKVIDDRCSDFDWCLDPQLNKALFETISFEKVAWSPLNCDNNGRCVVATLSSDHQLCIHLPPMLGFKWKEVVNLSQALRSHVAANNFKIHQNVMQTQQEKTSQPKHVFSNSESVKKFNERTQLLSTTCLHWFSEIYHHNRDSITDETGSSGSDGRFAVLATGNQSGHVIFWKAALPITMNSTSVELQGFLDTHQSWPCSLSWRSITNTHGLLAVGSIDGFVKVFSIAVLPSVTGLADYVFWGDRDEMQVHWMEWMPSPQANTSYQLVVSKGSSVIIFSFSVKGTVLSQKPTYKIITEVHRLPITGLTCARGGTVFSCSLDGSVQMLTSDKTPPRSIDYNAKKRFLCNGIGVSANAVFVALFLFPSNYTSQSLESHQTQILFINISDGSSAVDQFLSNESVNVENKWDVFKAMQLFVSQSKHLTLAFFTDPSHYSYGLLILRQYVLSLVALMFSEGEGNDNTNYSVQLEYTVRYMYKCLGTATLRKWIEGRASETVNQSDSLTALLISDWLVMNFNDPPVLDLVTNIYSMCGDAEGLKATSAPQGQSKRNGEDLLHAKNVNDPQEQNIALQNSTEADDGRGAAAQPMEANHGPSLTPTLAGGLKDQISLPSREKCPICESDIPMENMENGTCRNGHKWQRCCAKFTVCSELFHKRCQDCSRCVSMPYSGLSPWMCGLLESITKCPFCFGFFSTLS